MIHRTNNVIKKILILGRYGGVGKSISKYLLTYNDSEITICGHKEEKVRDFDLLLRSKFPNRHIHEATADATDSTSLLRAFSEINLVVVATSTPGSIE